MPPWCYTPLSHSLHRLKPLFSFTIENMFDILWICPFIKVDLSPLPVYILQTVLCSFGLYWTGQK
uniref:Uncharacterized protein n=1 Tax=Oryzias latipes TaxID=8090 RepID=A0A3P9IWI1_ORYLA